MPKCPVTFDVMCFFPAGLQSPLQAPEGDCSCQSNWSRSCWAKEFGCDPFFLFYALPVYKSHFGYLTITVVNVCLDFNIYINESLILPIMIFRTLIVELDNHTVFDLTDVFAFDRTIPLLVNKSCLVSIREPLICCLVQETILREAQLLSQICHPNVLPMLACFVQVSTRTMLKNITAWCLKHFSSLLLHAGRPKRLITISDLACLVWHCINSAKEIQSAGKRGAQVLLPLLMWPN